MHILSNEDKEESIEEFVERETAGGISERKTQRQQLNDSRMISRMLEFRE
jgi:hypothetical protein